MLKMPQNTKMTEIDPYLAFFGYDCQAEAPGWRFLKFLGHSEAVNQDMLDDFILECAARSTKEVMGNRVALVEVSGEGHHIILDYPGMQEW